MEIAGELHRSPRETLKLLTMREWWAYVNLSLDRADEYDEIKEGRGDEDEDEQAVLDLSEPRSPEEIAAIFGARVVKH